MKAVLISIQPKWCELIARGKKTVEVRKTRPKIDVPFKCYIYCTQGDALAMPCLNAPQYTIHRMGNGTIKGRQMTVKEREQSDHLYANGKVIGEFVCDRIDEIGYSPEMHGQYVSNIENLHEVSCVNFEEMFDYIADGFGYGWHISDLVIYDKPKELSEFISTKALSYDEWFDGVFDGSGFAQRKYQLYLNTFRLKRPPQSWCYVEKLGV